MPTPRVNEEPDYAGLRAEGVTAFGQMLGLHPEFVTDVVARGQEAIIQRAEVVDQIGGQGKLLGMAQQLGMFLQRRLESAGPPKMGAIQDAIEMIADANQVPRDTALYLLGAVFESFQRACKRLGKGAVNGNVSNGNGRTADGRGRR